MADGEHCPGCGNDVGYWPVALGMFRIRCPHCRASLYYAQSRRMNWLTSAVAMGTVLGTLVPGAVAGWAVRASGPIVALAVGALVCIVLSFSLGLLGQIALTPTMRRTQTLRMTGRRGETIDDDTW